MYCVTSISYLYIQIIMLIMYYAGAANANGPSGPMAQCQAEVYLKPLPQLHSPSRKVRRPLLSIESYLQYPYSECKYHLLAPETS